MKILIFRTVGDVLDIKSYNSQEIGLAKAFVKLGHECDIAYFGGKEPTHRQNIPCEGDCSISLYWLKGTSVLKNGVFFGIRSFLKQYDCIQVSEYDQLTSWYLYRFWKHGQVSVYHGPYASKFTKRYNLKCKAFDFFFNNKKKNASVLAFVKSKLAEDFLREKGFEQVTTVGVGLDAQRFAGFGDLSPVAQHTGSFTILYVGAMEVRRDIETLIKGFALAQNNLNSVSFRLVLIGNGKPDYLEQCQLLAKQLGVSQQIEWHAKMPQVELPKYYQSADAFVLTTQYDIFGMVLLEAMHFGLPVISTLNGGSSTLIRDGETGFIIETGNERELADKLEMLAADDGLRHQLGAQARKILSQYSWDAIAQTMAEQYQLRMNDFGRR